MKHVASGLPVKSKQKAGITAHSAAASATVSCPRNRENKKYFNGSPKQVAAQVKAFLKDCK